MEQIVTNYVKPELLVLVIVLYFLGIGLKHAQTVKDKYIPYKSHRITLVKLLHICNFNKTFYLTRRHCIYTWFYKYSRLLWTIIQFGHLTEDFMLCHLRCLQILLLTLQTLH